MFSCPMATCKWHVIFIYPRPTPARLFPCSLLYFDRETPINHRRRPWFTFYLASHGGGSAATLLTPSQASILFFLGFINRGRRKVEEASSIERHGP